MQYNATTGDACHTSILVLIGNIYVDHARDRKDDDRIDHPDHGDHIDQGDGNAG